MSVDEGGWQHQAVRKQLKAGEHLLWLGRPDAIASALVRWGSFCWGLVFASPFLVAAYFAGLSVLQNRSKLAQLQHVSDADLLKDAQAFLLLGGLLSIFIVPVLGPFVYAALRGLSSPLRAFLAARATVYAVTDQRMLFLIGRNRARVESFDAGSLPIVHRTTRGRLANLVFPEMAVSKDIAKFNGGHKTAYQPLGLYHLPDADDAEHALLRMRKQAPDTGARSRGSDLGHALELPWPSGADGTRLAPDEALKSLLMPDETIQWSGRPRLIDTLKMKGAMVLGGILAAFAIIGFASIASNGLPLVGLLFIGLIFGGLLAAGVWLLTAPKWMPKRLQAERYAVTNRRLLVMAPAFGGKISVSSYIPPNLYLAGQTTNPDGSGSIEVRTSDWVQTYRTYNERTHSTQTTTRVAPGSMLEGLTPADLKAAWAALESLRDATPLVQPATVQEMVVAAAPQAPLATAFEAVQRPADFPAQLLNPGEEVRWLARPAVSVTIPQFLMGLFGVGIVLPGLFSVLGEILQGHFFAILEVLSDWPMVLIGLAVGAWPWLYHAAARSTLYAVTNQRALVLIGGFGGRRLRVFPPATLATRASVDRGNGRGDLVFNPDAMPVAQPVAIADSSGRGASRGPGKGFAALLEMLPFNKGFIGVPSLAEAEAAIARLLEEQEVTKSR